MVMPWRCACSCTCDACAAASDWLIGVASALFTSAVAIVPERALGSNQLVRILEQLAHTRGLPKAIRTDNELNAIGVLQKEQAHSWLSKQPKKQCCFNVCQGWIRLVARAVYVEHTTLDSVGVEAYSPRCSCTRRTAPTSGLRRCAEVALKNVGYINIAHSRDMS